MSLEHLRKLEIKKNIAGSIAISTNPGLLIRKWRGVFGASQRDLALEMKVSPSIISDYESGRRRHPTSARIRSMVDSLVSLDEKRKGVVLKHLSTFTNLTNQEIKFSELKESLPITEFCKLVGCELLFGSGEGKIERFCVTDSAGVVVDLTSDYFHSDRDQNWALIFTGDPSSIPVNAIGSSFLPPSLLVVFTEKRKKLLGHKTLHLATSAKKERLLTALEEFKL